MSERDAHMLNLFRTLLQSVIDMVLGNNGNVSLKELDNYVQDDVFRYGAKLEDMHKKLRQALDEQVSGLDFVSRQARFLNVPLSP